MPPLSTARRTALAIGLAAAVSALPATACDKAKQTQAAAHEASLVPAETLAALPVGQQIAVQGNAALVRIRSQIALAPIALPAVTVAAMPTAGADQTVLMDY